EALTERRQELHCCGGRTSREITAPLGPRAGNTRPFSSKLTPPALPTVRTKGPFDTHSRTWPAGTVSSVIRPSSVRTRIHVGSDTRATRRYGDVTEATTPLKSGIAGGADGGGDETAGGELGRGGGEAACGGLDGAGGGAAACGGLGGGAECALAVGGGDTWAVATGGGEAGGGAAGGGGVTRRGTDGGGGAAASPRARGGGPTAGRGAGARGA